MGQFPGDYDEAILADLSNNDEILIDVGGTKYIKVSELKKWMSLLETVSYSGAKTLALTDAGTKQISTGGSDHNVTIPTNATVAFPVGTVIIFRNEGAGFITVVPAVGVTLSGASTTFDSQYQEGYIHKVGTDSWQIVIGGVSAGGGGDVTAPSLVSATVEDANPDEIVLTYDEALNASIVPATSDYTPSGGKTVTNVAIVGAVVTLTVNTPYANGDTIDIDYAGTASLNPLQDAAGNEAADLTNEPVDNNIASGGGFDIFTDYAWTSIYDADQDVTLAAAPATDGGQVDTWADQGAGYDLTKGTSANQPTYRSTGINGKPAIEMNYTGGNFKNLSTSSHTAISTPYCYYFIAQVVTMPSAYVFLLSGTQDFNAYIHGGAGDFLAVHAGGGVPDTSYAFTAGTPVVIGIHWNGDGTADVYANENLVGSAVSVGGNSSLTVTHIGSSDASCAHFRMRHLFVGPIPSAGDRADIIDWLKTDAGI